MLPPSQKAFLGGTPWADWRVEPMTGDADARRYWRLTDPRTGASAVLMDMSMSPAPAFAAFCRIGDHLRAAGLAAPEVFHAVARTQMLLLEDLGPLTLAAAIRAGADEARLYGAATDAILAVQATPVPTGLPRMTPETGADMLAPLFDHYVRRAPEAERLESAMRDALADHAGPPDRLSLRDYFSENLIWRADRDGMSRLGILDFQDAFIAPAAYDPASLLRDARRDVGAAATETALTRFADGTGMTRSALDAAVAVLSVQRNLRILGIFARLASRDGKTRYLPMIPRVRAHVLHDAAHPALAALRRPVEAALAGETLR